MPAIAASAIAGNWWEAGGATGCVAVYQAKSTPSYAASLLDLSGNGNNAAKVGATDPNWTAEQGWIFNGTQTLTTGIIPGSGWSAIVQFTSVSNNGSLFGQGTWGGERFYIQPSNTTSEVDYGAIGFVRKAPALGAGNLCIAGQKAYRKGQWDADIPTAGLVSTAPCYIGDINGLVSRISANIQAFALYNNPLLSNQVDEIARDMEKIGLIPKGTVFIIRGK